MRLRILLPLLSCCCILSSAFPLQCSGDVFYYRDGRVVSGKITDAQKVEIDGRTVNQWTVQTRTGVLLQVLESELELNGRHTLNEGEVEYPKKFLEISPQTAQDHYELAGWCSSKQLKELAAAHYEAALDLDPDHSAARTAAGYEDIEGRWVREEYLMGVMRGKVWYKRRWRWPEEVAVMKQNDQADALMAEVKREWTVLNNQAAFLRTVSQDIRQQAIQKISQIRDPRAVPIFSEHLTNTKKPAPPQVRMAYVTLLSNFPQAAGTLARVSVTDSELAVRNRCLDALRGVNPDVVLPIYLSYLTNSNNTLINNAAEGIAQLNSRDAVLPLIDSLVTTHEFKTGSNPGGINASPANGGFTMGGPSSVKRPVPNESVLNALNQITGQNFEYERDNWIAWYARTYAKSAGDLRRDP